MAPLTLNSPAVSANAPFDNAHTGKQGTQNRGGVRRVDACTSLGIEIDSDFVRRVLDKHYRAVDSGCNLPMAYTVARVLLRMVGYAERR